MLGTQEASTPPEAWRQPGFPEEGWLSGDGPIGFAVPANDAGGYEATIRTTLPTSTLSNYTAVYLRKTFVVSNVAEVVQLRLGVVVDDGFVAWLNGTEIGRSNAPAGELTFTNAAASAIEPTAWTVIVSNPASLLVAGTNVLAVQLLNSGSTSSDLFLDATLSGIEPDLVPPTIIEISPAPGSVGSLAQISVSFSEWVSGVEAGDLLINGQPAYAVTSNANTYVFSFIPPPAGTVQISWSPAHGIQDFGIPPNPFEATAPGASWQYELLDRIPPTVTALIPPAGLTVRSLAQLEVRFSEAVAGLDASDLVINGAPATGLSSTEPGRYVFAFPPPPTGAVRVAWAPNHGITDTATPPNPFAAGPAWTYLLDPNAPLADVVISEFLASNPVWTSSNTPPQNKWRDEDGDYSDWIELFNSSDRGVDLAGWHLTDSANNLAKWTFPATNLPPKSHLVVFASEKNRRTAGRPLHTNFKLSQGGEFLALVRPDGRTVASAFSPAFPPQLDDVSFGLPTLSTPVTLIATDSPVTVWVPMNDSLGLEWARPVFDDSSWLRATNGVGFERATNPAPALAGWVRSDVESRMFERNSSLFVRLPFVVTDVSQLDVLSLRLRYDDGFVAYLNGQEVARANVPTNVTGQPLAWNDHATVERLNSAATNAEVVDLTALLREGGVQTGSNLLAIHGFNWAADDGDLLLSAELVGEHRLVQLDQTRYFTSPTPGADNGAGTESLGPIISDVTPTPQTPQDQDDLLVTARLTPTFAPVGLVTLWYRVMYGSEVALVMLDDGQHGDGAPNDGLYAATIPAASLTQPGEMIRWYVRATDVQGRTSRAPAFQDPLNSPQYFGTVVSVAQTNPLPILHWFLQSPAAAATLAGTRGSVSYLGQFYDNVFANIHGQSSQGFPKKSYNLDFARGDDFLFDPQQARVGGINLLTTYADKAHMRNMLAYGTYRDAGSAYHLVLPVRVHTNGAFAGDWEFVEKGDADFLRRLGKDPAGALYKMYNTFTDPATDALISSTEAEKKTRKQEGNADLVALMAGTQLPLATRTVYFYDHVNIPQMINFLAAKILTGDVDCCHKNYYLYRDSNGTGEWEAFPWDVDLSFGRTWNSTDTYWNQVLNPSTGIDIGNNNGVFSLLLTGTTPTRQMYLRRIRTLMDQMLGTNTAPVSNFEAQIDYWLQVVGPDAAVDAVKWPYAQTWGTSGGVAGSGTSTCCRQTMAEAATELKASYLPQRRTYLYTAALGFPAAQPSNTVVRIRSVEYSPTNGNQLQEHVELYNTNNYAVDISGWLLGGAVSYTFQGGVVIPPLTSLYVSPDVNAWRARTTGPRGGQGLFVQGNYQGQLSARGETVTLVNAAGRPVSALTYAGSPSLAQQYLRLTELMYHPALLAGDTNAAEDFEYLELKNLGPVALDLRGVHLTDGIVFDFGSGAVTNLAPGQTVLVVKNPEAFTARYGSGSLVAGTFTGSLENAGERLRLLDAVGEEILDFTYNNAWYPLTDGLGFSLVVVNEQAPPDDWTHAEQWRPSHRQFGSPGADEPVAPPFQPVLINEALTRSSLLPDSIELFNPNSNAVDVSGWYLTDDFANPYKFRLPSGTVLGPGAFRVFTEADFNATPGLATSFALSSEGEEVYLFGAEADGWLNGYFHGFAFGAAEEEVSFGRYLTSDGRELFVPQSALSLPGPNASPKVGPVVISEIMYHPPDSGPNDNSTDEFVELLNISSNAVPLFDPWRPTNTWQLSGGLAFEFPTNVWLAPGATLLVLNIAPTNATALAAFRLVYGLDTNAQVFGPYSGKLNNQTDKVNLLRPTAPVTNQFSLAVPYARVDRVEYHQAAPWPRAADGLGYSLQRWDAGAFGDDPTNWVAARPTPAAPTATNGAPARITGQPLAQQTLIVGQSGALVVVATGTAPLSYQWRLNGTNVPGATNGTWVLTNVQPAHAGQYEVLVNNPWGAVVSVPASVIVRYPVAIVQQPKTIDVRVQPDAAAAATTNVTFTVAASSLGPIRYQWRRDGHDLPGATNDNYTVVDVKTTDLATFSVLVSDDISSVLSTNAGLYPLVTPNFVEPPISQSVAVGSQVTLSTLVSGWPPPFTFEWRLGAAILGGATNDAPMAFYTFLAPTNVTSVSYRAVIRNRALPSGRASGFATITTLADSDGDGLPDAWETAYGLSPTNAVDRLADSDGDGLPDWLEYQAGTDPTNAASALRITSAVWSNGLFRMEFPAVSNKTYAIQRKRSLAGTNWDVLSGLVARKTNHTEVVADPAAPTNAYYRLVTPAPR